MSNFRSKTVTQNNSRKDPKIDDTSVFRLRSSVPFANEFKATGKKVYNHINNTLKWKH
ncbi:hypothetical protein SAMN00777080_0831 [Aquiflexum balticum DSM 16537]|uniref:Uncharacterized protein n=1 Tax=Aquiflexum balticum DSM 16537 TaxID=758820 RepID=A0A1W2H0I2_9BACT|nr:hypothetical protein SAMN00777080_0831 [Aquiflexum balticum DSM 16537]